MKNSNTYLPLLVLLLFLSGMGVYLYRFTSYDVHWPGYFSMAIFYCFIFYLGSVVAKQRQSNSSLDMMLAGRKIPLIIAIFTMSATWVGGGFINGTAEYTSSSGFLWVQAPWGYALSLVVGGLFFAKKMRRFKFRTMLDPLEQRFGKRMTAVLFIPALSGEIFWTSAILAALGTSFGTILGLDFTTSIILSAIVAVAYTALGGLWAVALTDIFQLLFLFIGLLLVVPFAISSVGGWEGAWSTYVEKHGAAASFLPTKAALGEYYWNWWDYALLLIFGGVPWQVYFQRVLSSKTPEVARNLSIIAGVVCILAAIPPMIIGVVGSGVADWTIFGAVANPESDALLLPYVVRYLTPTLVATIGLGAIAAAVMSSVDSSILSASSMASWNVYRPLVLKSKKSDDDKNQNSEKISRVIKQCIWIVGVAATIVALKVKSVYALWFLCSDFVYCLLFPALVTALFDKKANVYGAAAGFIVAAILRFGGGEAILGLPQFIDYPMTTEDGVLFPFRTLAMVSGLITIIVVSRLTQKIEPPKALEVAT